MPGTRADLPAARVPVLLTARELNTGGVERDVAKIALGLDRTRFAPHVGTFHPGGLRHTELRDAGVPVVVIPVRSLVSIGALRYAFALRRYIRANGIRIVHSYDASGVFCIPVARLAGVPVTIGSQLSYRDILDSRTQKLLRWHDRWPDAILVNCEAMRRYMVDDEHVPAERIELCYNGVETRDFYPAPPEQPRPALLSGASLVVGAVCVLRPEKNLPLLQLAFSRVFRERPDVKLLIVGSGVELENLQANAARLGIAHQSIFHPSTADVAPWLRAIDVFVLCSYSEAFSNALLEAMACGCAVIGSRVGGTPELIGDSQRGLLFESRDAGDLALKLACLASDDALRRELGRSAAEFARNCLSMEVAVSRTSAIYDRLLQRKASRDGLR